MVVENLTTIIQAGLNDPNCAFYTGALVGGALYLKVGFYIFVGYMIIKAVDKLAWEPFLSWMKVKLWKK